MKKPKNAILNYDFKIKKTTLGRVNSGGVFLYRNRLWTVLNPAQAKGGKFVRTLEGTFHKSRIMPSKTNVYFIESGKINSITSDD